MKEKTKKRLKKYGLDLLGILLILGGITVTFTVIPGTTYLILTGLGLIIGKRGVKKLEYKVIPWLKKKHAAHKRRKLAKKKAKAKKK